MEVNLSLPLVLEFADPVDQRTRERCSQANIQKEALERNETVAYQGRQVRKTFTGKNHRIPNTMLHRTNDHTMMKSPPINW